MSYKGLSCQPHPTPIPAPELVQQRICLLLHCCQLLIPRLEQQLPDAFALTNDVLQLLVMLLLLLLQVLVVQGWW